MRFLIYFIFSLSLLSSSLVGAEFIRGDANNDGKVSFADSHFILSHFWWMKDFISKPDDPVNLCWKASDVDDNGWLEVVDGRRLLDYFVEGRFPPEAPFPQLGEDPSDDPLVCDHYENQGTLEDPLAALSIAGRSLDSEGQARFEVELASSLQVAGYFLHVSFEQPIVEGIITSEELTSDDPMDFLGVRLVDGDLRIGVLRSVVHVPEFSAPVIEGSEDLRPVLHVDVCLVPGTSAGDYPLRLESAEIVEAHSGKSIEPEILEGSLMVVQDVPEDSTCETTVITASQPSESIVKFNVSAEDSPQGEVVHVDWYLWANSDLEGVTFSLDFDEEQLEIVDIELVEPKTGGIARPFSTEWGLWEYTFNNENKTPGNAGVDEGYVAGRAIFRNETKENPFPEGGRPFIRFHFWMKNVNPSDCLPVQFVDGGVHRNVEGDIPQLNSALAFGGQSIYQLNAKEFKLGDAFIFVDQEEVEPKDSRVQLELESKTVAVGEEFTVPVFIQANFRLNFSQVHIEFDPERLEALDAYPIYEVLDWHSDTFPGWFIWESTIDNENGSASVNGLTGNNGCDLPPKDERTAVYEFRFKAKPSQELGNTPILISPLSIRIGDPTASFILYREGSVPPQNATYTDAIITVDPGSSHPFKRSDCNGDGASDVSDAVFSLEALFLGKSEPHCEDACDSNDDGAFDISDVIHTLSVNFLGIGVFPQPGSFDCGEDPNDDTLVCLAYRSCE